MMPFLHQKKAKPVDPKNKKETYTESGEYLFNTTKWHYSSDVIELFLKLDKYISPYDTITDVGCCSGMSGLVLALNGYSKVTFHDFEGIGLDFARYAIEEWRLKDARVVPYGQPLLKSDWVLCLDVLEHTGNHLATLKWLEQLTKNYVVLTYPLSVPFDPPFVPSGIDEWVDDEAVQWVIAQRYITLETYIADGRRYTIYYLAP